MATFGVRLIYSAGHVSLKFNTKYSFSDNQILQDFFIIKTIREFLIQTNLIMMPIFSLSIFKIR